MTAGLPAFIPGSPVTDGFMPADRRESLVAWLSL
jgi:hypothetical protein